MRGRDVHPDLFRRFAELLEYPGPGLVEAARECEALTGHSVPEAAPLLHEFRSFVEATPAGRVEEIYSATFDLDAAYHPYVGYHLFGETYKRSLFMLELRERYRAQGFVVEQELPDHLAVLLRFLARHSESDLAGEILHEALLPALDRMTGKARSAGYDDESSGLPDRERARHPYRAVLEGLRLVLGALARGDAGDPAVADRSSLKES